MRDVYDENHNIICDDEDEGEGKLVFSDPPPNSKVAKPSQGSTEPSSVQQKVVAG